MRQIRASLTSSSRRIAPRFGELTPLGLFPQLIAFSDNYYRIDEPFGLSSFDLLDVYQGDLVKAHVNDWLKMNVEYIRNVAEKLGAKSVKSTALEIAKTIKHPPSPIGTKDRPRAAAVEKYLR